MSDMGEVVGVSFGKSFRSEKDVVKLDVIISDPKDVQRIEYLPESGETSVPTVGDTVLIHEVADEYKVATAVNTGIVTATLKQGEKSIFAVGDGEIKSVINLLKNGDVVLNNGTDYAVEFGKLKSGFDTLKDFVNTHIHPFTGLDAGVVGATSKVAVPSSASIDSSKVEKVRI